MKHPTTVDLGEFNRSLEALARFSGVSVDRVIESEAGKVLEAAIKYTPAAKVATIRANVESRKFTTVDGKVYFLENRYPDRVWSRISKSRKANLKKKMKARGLSKASWLALARAAGLSIAAPGFVSGAQATSGQTYPENAIVRRVKVQGRWGLFFENHQPTVQTPFVKGRGALARAIRGRQKFFEANLKRGVFSDLQQIARAYPGLEVKR
jgi:hypothetical protein